MMEKLNGVSNNFFLKLLLGFIAVTFVISSMAGYVYTRTDTSAAKVNGEEISQRAFQTQYENEIQRLSQELGAQFAAVADTPEFTSNLRKQILNNLIDQTLLGQFVKDLKIGASDKQIEQYIVTSPSFQRDGKFDNNLYRELLQYSGLTPNAYAESVREGLRLAQLQTGLAGTAFIVPEQQQELAKLFFQQRDVRFAKLPAHADAASQSVSDEEIAQYYNDNKGAFLIPELVKVQYIELTGAEIEKKLQVSDVEVAQYYQDNKAQFMSQSQQRVAHIQVKSEQLAQDLYQQLQNGANFADLAKNHSTDALSAENGGDLSWISAGQFPKVFEDAANALQVGQYSQPVKVDNSYHIILVEERKEPTVLPLEQVKSQIISQIRQNLVNNQFYSVEKQVAEKAFEDQKSLDSAAQAAGVQVQETALFSRKDVPAALNFPNVVSAMFTGDISQGGVNSEPMSVGDQHSLVVRVLEHKAEGTRSLEEAKADIRTYLQQQKLQQQLLAEGEALAKQLNEAQGNPQSLAFGASQSWVFAKNQDPALNDVVFSMAKPNGKTVYQAAKNDKGEVLIIALDKVTDGNLSAQELKLFTAQMEQANQIQLQNDLLSHLRNKAKIEINDDFMQEREPQ